MEMVANCQIGPRGGSVLSRHSAHGSSIHSNDGSGNNKVRAHPVLSKQDSDKSGMSTASQGSGKCGSCICTLNLK